MGDDAFVRSESPSVGKSFGVIEGNVFTLSRGDRLRASAKMNRRNFLLRVRWVDDQRSSSETAPQALSRAEGLHLI